MPLNGIDISGYQPGNLPALVPADFVIVKATGGNWFVNPNLGAQYSTADSLTHRTGLYHFAGDGGALVSAREEAECFLAQWAQLVPLGWDTIPVLDWEDARRIADVAWATEWCRIVKERTGKTPLLYCNLTVAQDYDWSPVQALGVKLWLAWYGNDAPINGYQPPFIFDSEAVSDYWDLAMWQYTQHGRLPGYSGELDLNVAYQDVWATLATDSDLIPGVQGVEA